jgi:5-formyltetrahydrofolate cyclo-ligase
LRARRNRLGAAERIAAAQNLVAQLERIPEFLIDRDVAGYWAVAGELPLLAVIAGLRARGQQYWLPIVGDAGQLAFAAWQPGIEIAANRFGIPEPVVDASERAQPADLDVVLLPLLGFDRRGNRLGFGGGYYDRSFAFLRARAGAGKPLLVGIGYAMQEVDAIEPMPWDVRLDYIATDRELVDLTPPE